MGRLTTAAIIALALTGAAVESHAGGLTAGGPGNGPGAAPSVAAPSVAVGQLLADAAPAPAVVPDAPPPPPGGPLGAMPPPRPMGWAGHPGMHDAMMHMRQMHRMMRTWGLFFDQHDKKLSDGDVQVLAQAILLAHGNHSWNVTDVADAADGQVTFAYAAADGSVIARFSVDRHSGRMTRIG